MLMRLPIRQIWGWWAGRRFSRLFAVAILLGTLGIGGVLALRVLRPAAPAQILPGQTLAWDIARSLTQAEGVEVASGAYLPGERILLYTRTSEADRVRLRSWALVELEPFAERLAKMAARESLTWVIDYGPTAGSQETIMVDLGHVMKPAYYRYVSAEPGLLVASGASTAPGASQALAQPGANPTAAPSLQPTAAPAPGATQSAAQTSGAPAANDVAQNGQLVLASTFDPNDSQAGGTSLWLPLSGRWAIADGIYTQQDNNGYDLISLLNLEPQSNYRIETRMRLAEGTMGGGFIYNAPTLTSRNGAQSVDIDNQGGFLRWGRYDANGAYVYEGGTVLDPAINDGQWHTLSLENRGASSVIALNGNQLGTISNTSQSGYYGLIASMMKVDFDDVQVASLSGAAPAAPPTAAVLTSFSDDFASGIKGWRVLSGTWQNSEGTYQQSDTTGSDHGSMTLFSGDSYSMTVRLQYLDGDMGAGIYFNAAERTNKSRSQMINYTEGGKALQWGHFDEGGNFVFDGSAPVPDGSDGTWHTLGLRVQGGKATFSLDGKEVAVGVPLTYTSGYLGLMASHCKVAFDDVQITPQ